MIEQAKFTYSHLQKQMKTIENQCEKEIKAIEQHGKQLVTSNALNEKNNLSLDKQNKKYFIGLL